MLTAGADIGTALPDGEFDDFCIALRAMLGLPLVDLEAILKLPTAIHPVQACAEILNPCIEDLPNSIEEGNGFFF